MSVILTGVMSVPVLADLREIPPSDGQVIMTIGGATMVDGMGGIYFWSPTSTEADDGDKAVRSNVSQTGRWLRRGNIRLMQPVVKLGDITVGEAASLISIALGIRQVTASLPGVLPGSKLQAYMTAYRLNSQTAPYTAGAPAGYSVVDCVSNKADEVRVSLNAPALSIGANYSLKLEVCQLNL